MILLSKSIAKYCTILFGKIRKKMGIYLEKNGFWGQGKTSHASVELF